MHLGRERVICCWQAGDVLIDPGPTSCLPTLLEALGERRPRVLLLTHIHLDHAGASGSLVERWPELEVYVHERGARHLIDPSRLLESARRLYGEDMDRLWGEVLPVPEARGAGANRWRAAARRRRSRSPTRRATRPITSPTYTSGTAFVGDVAGVRITPDTLDGAANAAAGYRRRGMARLDRSAGAPGVRSAWR